MQEPSSPQNTDTVGGLRYAFVSVFACWMLLLAASFARSPIPYSNEPHYLGKAKHYWDQSWCQGDFFLESSNPHAVFYQTFGWLTCFFSLEVSAIIGRAIGLLIVAIGWHRLADVLLRVRWAGFSALVAYLVFDSFFHFSGEWLVRGIESKVPSYGFLFWGYACLLQRRLYRACLLGGLAVSFHPLVGIWGVLAAVISEGWCVFAATRRSHVTPSDPAVPPRPYTLKHLVIAAAIGFLASAPGLIPALEAMRSDDPIASRNATLLQVGSRLPHHLDPMRFKVMAFPTFIVCFGATLLIWRKQTATFVDRHWRGIVVCSVLFAVVGLAVGLGPRPLSKMPYYEIRASLLKFYFFRLSDMLIPVSLSFAIVRGLDYFVRTLGDSKRERTAWSITWVLIIVFLVINSSVHIPSASEAQLTKDWHAASSWLKNETPKNSLVQVIEKGWSAKWFAERPEYVNYKDMPQDAKSLVEWNRRLWVLADWRKASYLDGSVSFEDLQRLRELTGIRYLVTAKMAPIDVTPTFESGQFRVYELPDSK